MHEGATSFHAASRSPSGEQRKQAGVSQSSTVKKKKKTTETERSQECQSSAAGEDELSWSAQISERKESWVTALRMKHKYVGTKNAGKDKQAEKQREAKQGEKLERGGAERCRRRQSLGKKVGEK